MNDCQKRGHLKLSIICGDCGRVVNRATIKEPTEWISVKENPPKKDGTGSHAEEVIKNIPLDMIMTDTDCPYLTPVPHRGERNEPLYVIEIYKKIAEIKGLPLEEVSQAIVSNAKRLFDI